MKKVGKEDFYSTLQQLIQDANKSVKFYSISCCFGFYSQGLRNFEEVYHCIKEAMSRRRGGQYLDVQALIKVDRDNPIDMYAAERLAHLQSRSEDFPGAEGRIVFKELISSCQPVQFLIVDDEFLLVSEVQDETYNEELDLLLNTAEPGRLIDDPAEDRRFHECASLFAEHWSSSVRLRVPTPQISRVKLKHLLRKFSLARNISSEREFQIVLLGFLLGLYDPAIVDMESALGSTRIDLLIGDSPQHKRLGIEVKFASENRDINQIVGQMRDYHKEYENLMLVVGRPKYTRQQRQNLLNELAELNVTLVEID